MSTFKQPIDFTDSLWSDIAVEASNYIKTDIVREYFINIAGLMKLHNTEVTDSDIIEYIKIKRINVDKSKLKENTQMATQSKESTELNDI